MATVTGNDLRLKGQPMLWQAALRGVLARAIARHPQPRLFPMGFSSRAYRGHRVEAFRDVGFRV